ncbi:Probable phosphomevalonate kinase [Taphrina deformans PYCC 5710]|uniref:phosphomevalonate kinase n=1 Tax=Taphrina deformans (strain PYCC 5710 / ATCC 11124 / CBS 356.35 / IMI 108563 / JCM 9778 / NBRC 8474) TaxID=1097556 RepID=R4XJR3_TAPDE|nr:Probable phosphomevalonate kinase [Taphrina deformans PYCC 5710]|eukprot:CCG83580.1 Probable phosphomevalonate kinase [Taphrina deformans PYCC 5710]
MVQTTCSAPGKILIAGGYLVLDPNYTGLVVSLSARIYATVKTDNVQNTISVTSPQFLDAVWKFKSVGGTIQTIGGHENDFVRESLQSLISYFAIEPENISLQITIYADNQYYSLPTSSARFASSKKSISETPKTGLGSSAALVTSLCAALYAYLTNNDDQSLNDQDIRTIHNLAQISHCRAQGKVGSGFDVASAVYGSCNYARFESRLIDDLSSSVDASALRDLADIQWPMTVQRIKLRPGLKLLMGDVAQGSSTPGMVKKVKACSAALDIWPSLGISNDLLSEYLTSQTPYDPADQSRVREMTSSVRGLLKQMGVEAKVEIEPDEQTKILDKTLLLDGVVTCGVPGAGGYDAIFAIVSTHLDAEDKVRELWSTDGIKMLDVRDDGDGIRLERDFDPK